MATKLLIHSQLDSFSIFAILTSFVNTWKVACFRLQDREESGSTKTAWGLGRDYFTALQPAETGKTTLLAKKLRLIDRCLCCCSYDNIFPWFDTLLLLTKCNRFFLLQVATKLRGIALLGSTVFIRLTVLGAYKIFGPWEWALIQGGRLFEAGRLLNFHHFQQVKNVYFATKQ